MYEDVFLPMLQRLAARTPIATIIDVGASDGRWSEMARKVWPAATLLMIEGNATHAPGMRERAIRMGGTIRSVFALAGGEIGSECVRFNTSDPFQGAPPDASGTCVGVTTIDTQVARFQCKGPYLVKLDCHGREHEILDGACTTLENTAALVVEVYTRSLGRDSLEMTDLLPVVKSWGFAPTDLCDPMIRPGDGRMSQVDMLFERIDAPGMDRGGFFA